MAKNKPSGKQHYELLFIISNRFTEDEAKKSVDRVLAIVKELDGEITLSDFWGKKRLAYAIQHENFGYYQLTEFNIERDQLKQLDEKLRLDSEVIRFMVVKKALKTEAQLKKEQANKEKLAVKKAGEVKVEKVTAPEVLENLDKKLDDILNASDLI